MSNPGYLIFDLDGTLVDSMETHSKVFAEILAPLGIDREISQAHYMTTAGESLSRQFRVLLQKHAPSWKGEIKDLIAQFRQQLHDHMVSEPSAADGMAFADVMDCIPVLHLAGYTLIVSSSGSPQLVQEKLELVGLAHYFSLILGSSDETGLAKGKPHFEEMQRQLRLTERELRSKAAFIGDGLYDIQVAEKAHMISIGRVGTNSEQVLATAKPDYIIETFDDLVWLLTDRSAISGFRAVSLLRSEEIHQNYRSYRRRKTAEMGLEVEEIPPEEFELVKIEYATLRDEILKRIEIRHQIVSLHLVVAGSFLTIGAQPDMPAVVLLVYPVLTMFIAASWARNDSRIKYIGVYIRDYIEILTQYVLWETHRLEEVAKPGFLKLSRLRIFSTMGLFLITQILALGLAFGKLVYSPEEIILLVLDMIALGVTAFFTLLRRGV